MLLPKLQKKLQYTITAASMTTTTTMLIKMMATIQSSITSQSRNLHLASQQYSPVAQSSLWSQDSPMQL